MRADSNVSRAHLKYRPDIDGLRAVAVLAVIGFHAFPRWMQGGLVGVDIFFVISGFLISSIIFERLLQDRFSYVDFYVRRIKRIFPALSLVLGACLVFGWFALYDSEYKSLGKHVAAGAVFIANFVLSKEAGYFDSQAVFKELLHLWSLGVEEQFYLIWPLLLVVLWKKTHTFLPLIVSLLIASFALNVWFIGSEPAVTFYSPITRFWELMLGSILAYSTHLAGVSTGTPATGKLRAHLLAGAQFRRALPEIYAWIGTTLLAIALYVINQQSQYPGLLALLPTLSAFLLIAAGPTSSINRYLLASRPMVWIGLISYPLYLWHWPILSFERLLSRDDPSRGSRAVAVLLSFILAWITYRLIEKPIRSSRKRTVAVILCGLVAVIGFAGLFIYNNDGLDFRSINATQTEGRTLLAELAVSEDEIRNNLYKTNDCDSLAIGTSAKTGCTSYGSPDADTIVVWGDSQAAAWSPVFYKIAEKNNLRVITFSTPGCPPLIQIRRIDIAGKAASCSSFGEGEQIIEAIASIKPKHIFLISFWSLYTPDRIEAKHKDSTTDKTSVGGVLEPQLINTLRALPAGTSVTIFRAAPVLVNDLARGLLRNVRIEPTAAEYSRGEANANHAIDAASATRANVTVFDPSTLQCIQICKAVVNGTLMYKNWGHISAQGALLYYDILSSDYFARADTGEILWP